MHRLVGKADLEPSDEYENTPTRPSHNDVEHACSRLLLCGDYRPLSSDFGSLTMP